jgi:hypothetical protein
MVGAMLSSFFYGDTDCDGDKLLIHRPRQIYELVLTFLPRGSPVLITSSIREEYTSLATT